MAYNTFTSGSCCFSSNLILLIRVFWTKCLFSLKGRSCHVFKRFLSIYSFIKTRCNWKFIHNAVLKCLLIWSNESCFWMRRFSFMVERKPKEVIRKTIQYKTKVNFLSSGSWLVFVWFSYRFFFLLLFPTLISEACWNTAFHAEINSPLVSQPSFCSDCSNVNSELPLLKA